MSLTVNHDQKNEKSVVCLFEKDATITTTTTINSIEIVLEINGKNTKVCLGGLGKKDFSINISASLQQKILYM